MLNIALIRADLNLVKKKLEMRGVKGSIIDDIYLKDTFWRETLIKLENTKKEINALSKDIGARKKNNEDNTYTEILIERVQDLKQEIIETEQKEKELRENIHTLLSSLPNMPHDSVPLGEDEENNVVIKTVGERKAFSFTPKAHEDLAESLDLIDFKRGAKVTGSRFVFYKGLGAKLERALISFMLDTHTEENGYEEFLPPQIVNEESLFATGQLPKFKEDLFKLENSNYYLIPTAEVPITNLHRGEILEKSALPLSYAGYSACFRSEAGSAGRDTKGIIRQHQFNKVELVKFVEPEKSYDMLETITLDAEGILEKLKLPYQRVLLCTGDIGFGSAKTYDLEVWFPSQNKYREISSATNFEDFQARRANIKYKEHKNDKAVFLHTLNASGLAVGRCVAAILENYQNEDGTVTIPEVLVPYMNNKSLLK